jgi:hypothetical protein
MFADLRFADSSLFGLKTSASPQISSFSPYKKIKQSLISNLYKTKNFFKKITLRTVLRQSSTVFENAVFADLQFAD